MNRHRSLLGLPILSPYNTAASVWSIFITFVDATYVAFLVPIILALSFDNPRVVGFYDWIGTLEIIAGGLKFVNTTTWMAMGVGLIDITYPLAQP